MLAFLMAEWRYVSIITFLGFLYHNIYHKGYESCETAVNKAVHEAQIDADKKLQELTDENTKERKYSKYLEGKLDVAIKNQPNSPISDNIIKLFNQIAK